MNTLDASLSRKGEGLADRKAGYSPVGKGENAMNQQQRIEAMKAEVASLDGTITAFGELPPDIEEEFLRQALKRPDRGQLHPMYPQTVEQG